jgi:hypothetical protein
MLLRSRKRKTKQNMHIHEWKDEPLPILKKEKKKNNQTNKQPPIVGRLEMTPKAKEKNST